MKRSATINEIPAEQRLDWVGLEPAAKSSAIHLLPLLISLALCAATVCAAVVLFFRLL